VSKRSFGLVAPAGKSEFRSQEPEFRGQRSKVGSEHSASASVWVSAVFQVAALDSGCAGGFAAGASYLVVLPEKDSPHPVGAVFNRDQENGTGVIDAQALTLPLKYPA